MYLLLLQYLCHEFWFEYCTRQQTLRWNANVMQINYFVLFYSSRNKLHEDVFLHEILNTSVIWIDNWADYQIKVSFVNQSSKLRLLSILCSIHFWLNIWTNFLFLSHNLNLINWVTDLTESQNYRISHYPTQKKINHGFQDFYWFVSENILYSIYTIIALRLF